MAATRALRQAFGNRRFFPGLPQNEAICASVNFDFSCLHSVLTGIFQPQPV